MKDLRYLPKDHSGADPFHDMFPGSRSTLRNIALYGRLLLPVINELYGVIHAPNKEQQHDQHHCADEDLHARRQYFSLPRLARHRPVLGVPEEKLAQEEAEAEDDH